MFYLMLSFVISACFKLGVLGSACPKLPLFSVMHYRQCCSGIYILWVSGNKILTFPWRFSANSTSRGGKRKAAAGAALGLQHLSSMLGWLEPASAAVWAWSWWLSGWIRAVAFWGWSLGGGRAMQWPSEVSSFPGKSVSDHTSGELWGGEVVIHTREVQ